MTKKFVLTYCLFLLVCITLGGLVLLALVKPRTSEEPDPRHWITADMRRDVGKVARTPLPPFVRKDTDGEKIDIQAEVWKHPVFLIFIMDGCPCSYEAQPFFQRLYSAFGKDVEFIAVTDGTEAQAKEWKAHFQMVYPVISEPKKQLMHLYHAVHSAYTALITKEDGVSQMWPGYSRAELESIAAKLGTLVPQKPSFQFSDAPKKPTTGCIF